MSVDERKRSFELAVEATADRGRTIMSCSDQNLDVVLDLARHAVDVGADWIVVHAPTLHFHTERDEALVGYYRTIAEQVDIGIALWSHPDSGYLMSPDLCSRLADIETVVAIKYSVPRPMYSELTALASDRIQVSTASEVEWLDNVLELDWRLYLCSSPPFLLQTSSDRRMHDYTQAAFAGRADEARSISASLEPVRAALRDTRPPDKPHAHQKYWQELLGQVGGRVRAPLMELTEEEKRATRDAFEECGLEL
jgi:4-hydroxy-tetrahydrodipicolinate synthase